jgi:hypothetical protein
MVVMDTVGTLIKMDNKRLLTILVGLFIAFYMASQDDNLFQLFFAAAFAVIIYIIMQKKAETNKEQQQSLKSFIMEIEKLIQTHDTPEMMIETVYRFHKPLPDIRFIKSNPEVVDALYRLRFLLIYDKENFIDTIVLIEYFLKTHFNIMIGKYDARTYMPILKDIRAEILNNLHSCHYNIPNISTVYDSKDLDDNLKIGILRLVAVTYKYIKILRAKYKDELPQENLKNIGSSDPIKNNMYHMY